MGTVETSGQRNADSVSVNNSLISSQTESTANAGGVTINTQTLTVSDGGAVSAENVSGTSGNITITATKTTNLQQYLHELIFR